MHWMMVLFWFSEQLGYVKADLIIWFFWVASWLGYTLKAGRVEYMRTQGFQVALAAVGHMPWPYLWSRSCGYNQRGSAITAI